MTAIAYSEIFLSDAMDTLGEAIEYAVCMCGVDGQEFLNRFIASGVAEHFQEGGAAIPLRDVGHRIGTACHGAQWRFHTGG